MEDVNEISLSSFHTSSLSGITHAYFQQSFEGIPIRNGLGSIHLDRSGKVEFVNLSFYKNVKRKIIMTTSGISPKSARRFAAHSTDFPSREKQAATPAEADPRLVFIENDQGELILSYEVELPAAPQSDDQVLIWIDAGNGREPDCRLAYLRF